MRPCDQGTSDVHIGCRAEIERLRAAVVEIGVAHLAARAIITELVALLKEFDDEANNRQLDIHKLLRRHHLDA